AADQSNSEVRVEVAAPGARVHVAIEVRWQRDAHRARPTPEFHIADGTQRLHSHVDVTVAGVRGHGSSRRRHEDAAVSSARAHWSTRAFDLEIAVARGRNDAPL